MVFASCSSVLHCGDAGTGGPTLDVVRGHDHGSLAGGLSMATSMVLLLWLDLCGGNWHMLGRHSVPRILVHELVL